MKKLIPILVILMLFVVAGGVGYSIYGVGSDVDSIKSTNASEKKVTSEPSIQETYDAINQSSQHAIELSTTILSVWDGAIDKGMSFNNIFAYMFSGDTKNKENSGLGMVSDGFSEISWGDLANKMNLFASELTILEQDKTNIDKLMDQIKSISNDKNQTEIDALVNYYISYSKIYNAATSPSGNKMGYSSNLTTLLNEYEGAKIEVDMKLN